MTILSSPFPLSSKIFHQSLPCRSNLLFPFSLLSSSYPTLPFELETALCASLPYSLSRKSCGIFAFSCKKQVRRQRDDICQKKREERPCWCCWLFVCVQVDVLSAGCVAMPYYMFQGQRRVQNMSQINLFWDSFQQIPYAPDLNHTLQLIQTNKYLPFASTVSIDHMPLPLQEEDQLSIAGNLQEKTEIATATTIKKKRGGCTCKKTKCLKMYCECFREGRTCGEDCGCQGCSNDHEHSDCREKARESLLNKPGTKQQSKGCNCRKSQCQKKYCQCFNAGLSCGSHCHCEDCANGGCQSHSQTSSVLIEQKSEQSLFSTLL